MKTVIAASFLLSLASLTTASTVGYTLRAESSNKAINGKAVNANGNAFWIGKPTASFCPSQVPQDACPKGNETEILVGNDPSQPCQEHAICGGAGMVSHQLDFEAFLGSYHGVMLGDSRS